MKDNPTYACDECQCPAELTELVPFKDQHICRICHERYHVPAGRSTNRRDGNKLAKSDTRFEDWPRATGLTFLVRGRGAADVGGNHTGYRHTSVVVQEQTNETVERKRLWPKVMGEAAL